MAILSRPLRKKRTQTLLPDAGVQEDPVEDILAIDDVKVTRLARTRAEVGVALELLEDTSTLARMYGMTRVHL